MSNEDAADIVVGLVPVEVLRVKFAPETALECVRSAV